MGSGRGPRGGWVAWLWIACVAIGLCLALLGAPAVAAADPATTSVALSSSPAGPVTDQTATLTATVTSAAGTPSGTVEFDNHGTVVPGCSTQPLDATGTATCPASFPAASSPESLTAIYTPADPTAFSGSTSDPFALTVAAAPSTTSLTASSTSPSAGDLVTYTASVAPATPGPTVPTGSVQFFDSGTPIQECAGQTLSSGTATCALTYSGTGSHTITATYGGDPNFTGSSSSPQTVTVGNAASTTTLTSSPVGPVTNQLVTLTAAVAGGDGTPAGAVTFANGGTPISGCGGLPLDGSGTATCTTSFAATSSPESLTAAYAPDGASPYSPSSGTETLGVIQAATTSTLAASTLSPIVGQSVTYTATIAPGQSGPVEPTGTVQFVDGTTPIACSPQSLTQGATSSTATCTTSYTAVGPHTITAVYGGDGNFSGSTAAPVTVTAQPVPTSTQVTHTPSELVTNQPVTLTATVTSLSGTPTGTVAFSDNEGAIAGCGTRPVAGSGVATCQTSLPGASSPEDVTATYTPSGTFASSKGSDSVPVAQDATAIALAASNTAPQAGQTVVYNATLAPTYSGPVTPGGTVSFSDGGQPVTCNHPPTLTGDTASCAVTYTSPGTHSVLATYSGDGNFAGSSSNPEAVTVGSTGSSLGLTHSPAIPVTNQTETLTATVAGADGTPTGTIDFARAGTTICSQVPLNASGTATCQTTFTATGSPYGLTATYTPGSSSPYTRSSSSDSVTVAKASSAMTLVPSTSSPTTGKAVTYTANITPGQSGSTEPSGHVEFLDGATPISTCASQPVTAGTASSTATCTVTYLNSGAHTIVATYSGDGNFTGSEAAPISVTATPPPVSVATLGPTSVTTTTATLRGTLSTAGSVFWQFVYGRSTNPASRTALSGPVSGAKTLSAVVKGLSPATTYHYELEAISSVAPTVGTLMTFTTKPLGALSLAFSSPLTAHSGALGLPLRCTYSKACTGRVNLTTTNGTKTLSCASPTYRVAAGKLQTVTTHLSSACITYGHAHSNRLTVKAVSVPSTPQLAVTKTVTVLLK